MKYFYCVWLLDSVTDAATNAYVISAGNSLPWIVIVIVVAIVVLIGLAVFIILRCGRRGDRYNGNYN